MYEVLFCFCILLHWRVFLPLVESSCQIWFPMLTFAFLSLPLLRKTDVKIRKQTEKRETKRKQETVFYVFLRMSLANIGKFKLSLKALILSVFTFICFLVFSNAFRRTKIFLTISFLNVTIVVYHYHNRGATDTPRFPLPDNPGSSPDRDPQPVLQPYVPHSSCLAVLTPGHTPCSYGSTFRQRRPPCPNI